MIRRRSRMRLGSRSISCIITWRIGFMSRLMTSKRLYFQMLARLRLIWLVLKSSYS